MMRSTAFSRRSLSLTATTALTLALGMSSLSAQGAEEMNPMPSMEDMKKAAKGETPIPSPFDAFIALEKVNASGTPVDWEEIMDTHVAAVDVSQYNGMVPVCLMLGVKISDGLIAIKSQDAAALNDISKAIETLAKKIDVGSEQLKRAEQVREEATNGDWLGVFLSLGELQEDIIRALSEENRKDQRALILSAGWLQGANYAAAAIEKNYSPEASGLLREPDLVGQLVADLEGTSDSVKSSPLVQSMLTELPTIKQTVSIPLNGTLEAAQVAEIHSKCRKLVEDIKAAK